MKVSIKEIILISRPRFWIYELGTFLIGILAANYFLQSGLSDLNFNSEKLWQIVIFAFYFLIPANILIYGINDIFDYESDKLNPKKVEYEELLLPEKHKSVWAWILLTNLPFIIFGFFVIENSLALISFFLFIFFATFYSAKPIRAKTKPILDSFFSASHYVVTGIFAWHLIIPENPSWFVVAGAMLWAFAMHAYSALPDIKADKLAGFQTVATFLGHIKTLILCDIFYFLAFLILAIKLNWKFIFIYLIYFMILAFSFNKKNENLLTLYKSFTFINFVAGGIISIYLILGAVQGF